MDCKKFILNFFKTINTGSTENSTSEESKSANVIIDVDQTSTVETTINTHQEVFDEIIINESSSNDQILIPPVKYIKPLLSLQKPYTQPKIYKDVCYLYDSFYIALFDSKLIFFENYNSRHCPLKGWFQECIKCSSITGQLYHYGTHDDEPLYIRMCERCSNNFDKFREDPLNIDIDNYIRKGLKIYKNIYLI